MEPRSQEEIDKEYAELCTKYGDIAQKLYHLEDQEKQAEVKIEEQLESIRLQFAQARGSFESELIKIKSRWKEMQVEVQSRLSQSNI